MTGVDVPAAEPVRVLLCDDQPLIRSGIRALLDAEDDVVVVGEAGDGEQAAELARDLRPDVVLMDVQMPVLDGIGATRRIAGDPALADVRIVVLTNYGLDAYVFAALRAGASGFLVKDTEPEAVLQALRVVMAGDALLSPAVTRTLIAEYVARPAVEPVGRDLGRLTDREQEVVALVGQGLSNDEIAAHMVISPATAKTHVSRAMAKVGARDRAQLVVFAYESRLVSPRDEPPA
ncbi:response regulator transcription factor [Luteimicrobium xylanilyticum]|uniref:Chemotaxis response regulator protein-glutamate methylesterase of group 2 operon n=1 Tax=Luteimicrobium xylanilyticum TaxID=1133546 RepID=A0A5P9QC21_9MICO|nr:response regulator transcription factor [Luteimicrobium xylanilyticum]QFU98998.1 Chemotaxis response regulator protein-glutamate methylesterase of group 2 operon [Luteimicrobium xylanilyticum]